MIRNAYFTPSKRHKITVMYNIRFRLLTRGLLFCGLSTLISFGVRSQVPISEQITEMYDIMTQYRADAGSLERFYFMNDSPEYRERFIALHQDYLDQLGSFSFERLSQGGQVDYLLFKRDLSFEITQLKKAEQEYQKIKDWVAPGEAIYPIEIKRRRGLYLDSQSTAETLNAVAKAYQMKKDSLSGCAPFLTTALARRAQATIKDQFKGLESVFEFYNAYDPMFGWWVTQPYKTLDTLMRSYADLFAKKIDPASQIKDDGSGIVGTPIGSEALIELLQYEMIPYTPEELITIANKEFAWCDKELLKASQDMGYGNDWRTAQEKVKQSYVPAGEQPTAMLQLYYQSIDFLKDNDLLTIPPIAEESWRMSMLSPERQRIAPFFLGGEVLQIAYPTDAMTHEEKLMSMRGNNPHFNRATVHHELIAGHHLQQFMNRRYKTHRNFRTPFWTEGWALYWELLLWDKKFPRSPEDRIGMLFWRMHRCARIIFSLNYHLGNWTPQQCIDFLVDRVGFERANAEGEVRRSFTANYGPLYQLAYMTGGLQFYALKKELVDSGMMSYKEYHDAVLQENAMPVEMVRALLLKHPLTEDYRSRWRFYDKE